MIPFLPNALLTSTIPGRYSKFKNSVILQRICGIYPAQGIHLGQVLKAILPCQIHCTENLVFCLIVLKKNPLHCRNYVLPICIDILSSKIL